jgi:hypothetical protein
MNARADLLRAAALGASVTVSTHTGARRRALPPPASSPVDTSVARKARRPSPRLPPRGGLSMKHKLYPWVTRVLPPRRRGAGARLAVTNPPVDGLWKTGTEARGPAASCNHAVFSFVTHGRAEAVLAPARGVSTALPPSRPPGVPPARVQPPPPAPIPPLPPEEPR